MVLISNGGVINIKNHRKIYGNEKKGENYNYSQNVNKIITNKYHGLLGDKYIYEGSDGETESEEEAKPVSKSKKK
jgi:hypothetical protein